MIKLMLNSTFLSLRHCFRVVVIVCLVKNVFSIMDETMTYNRRLDGFTITQIPGISFTECVNNCEKRSSCKSVNYQSRFTLCFINSASEDSASGNMLTEAIGFVYKAKKTEQSNAKECGDVTCVKGYICNENKKCVAQECEALPKSTESEEVLGNMLSVGDKVIVRCREGYLPSTVNKQITAECLDDGTWSCLLKCFKGQKNCKDLRNIGDTVSGYKTILPEGELTIQVIKVFCDMEEKVDGGGWVVIQRRESDSVDFYRRWNDYKNGFGDDKNFWLGLENIHRLTRQGNYELRVEMRMRNNEFAAAKYATFQIGDELSGYSLSVGSYSYDNNFVNPGNALAYHHGSRFSTKDKDNDKTYYRDCAEYQQGGWWYNSMTCSYTNLNGVFSSSDLQTGIDWETWVQTETLIFTRMLIRPK